MVHFYRRMRPQVPGRSKHASSRQSDAQTLLQALNSRILYAFVQHDHHVTQ